MNRDEIARRWRAAVDWLLHSTGQVPRLTAWGWAADAILALLLTIGAISGVTQHSDGAIVRPPFPMVEVTPAPPAPLAPKDPRDPEQPGNGLDPRFLLPLGENNDDGWPIALAALTALPLVTRRRYPLASFWIIAIATQQVYRLNGVDPIWTLIAAVVAAYSAPMYSRYRNLAMVSVVLAAVWVIAGSNDLPGLPTGVLTFLLISSVGLAANAIHTWRQRAQTLQREHEAATQLALDRERARLARELHDVVGHNVSVMVVQAGAARKVLDSAPDLAREALLAVEAGGRAAMTELRQVIGLLTPEAEPADLTPQPGIDQLADLAARIRETGVPVTLTITGSFNGLPTGVELAAYRVVQEALTNAVRHAAGAAVDICVSRTDGALRVEVTDAGGSPSAAVSGGGRGLAGLRDRLAVYGGTLTAGPRPTGGYRVVAEIPLGVGP